jgi:hypothetical protein
VLGLQQIRESACLTVVRRNESNRVGGLGNCLSNLELSGRTATVVRNTA